MSKLRTLGAGIIMALLVVACSSYYEVSDPSTGKTYYTKKIDEKRDGSIQFTDSNTGRTVSIQNSEVAKIKSDAYKAAVPKK